MSASPANERRKLADVPRRAAWIAQALLLLPVPYGFCLLAGQRLPDGFGGAAIDVGYMALTLLLLVPVMLVAMVVLKIYFYGSTLGTKRRVSIAHKKKVSIIFIAAAVPITCLVQAEAFLWMTDRARPMTFSAMAGNAVFLLVAGLPGLVVSVFELRKKVAAANAPVHSAGATPGN